MEMTSANLDRLLQAASRRVLAQRALRRAALGLAGGAAAGLLLLAADRAAGVTVPGLAYLVLLAAGLTGGVATAVWPRTPRLPVAAHLDRGLRLHDRLASALAVETEPDARRHDAAFAALVRRDADRLAARLDARPVTPVRLDRAWATAAVLVTMLGLGAWLVPDLASDRPERAAIAAERVEAQQRERVALADTINQAVESTLR